MFDDLFDALVAFTSADVDTRRGEAHITCPSCKHESSKQSPHCSFSRKGWKCFSCGESGGLTALARLLKYESDGQYNAIAKPHKEPERVYSWLSDPEPIIRRYEAATGRVERWQAHKPLKQETIISARLGVGVLPASKCHHERLIVPIFDGTLCVGLRGRWAGCACDPKADKWLVARGTTLKNLPLYGSDKLKPGCVVWLVENCVDARLISQETDFVGCAMYSVSYWRDEWAKALLAVQPEMVVVALDNDLVGNGGAWRHEEFSRLWMEKHNTDKVPEANGIKRVNQLRRFGLNAILYDWKDSPHKADVGSLIA